MTGVPVIVTSANPVRFCAPALAFASVLKEINSSVSFANAASSNIIVDPLLAVNSDVGNLTPLRNTSKNPTL